MHCFIAIAFGIAWAVAAYIYASGGLPDPITTSDHSRFLLVMVLTAGVYMMAPAFANLLTRLISREGFGNLWLKPRINHEWKYWLIAWTLPALLTLMGIVLYYLIFPNYFDINMSNINKTGPSGGSVDPRLLAIILMLQAVFVSPFLNSLFTFGEEFGWRGYLLQKLMPLGGRTAVLVLGVIWGIWHWPLTAMGHNYGLSYPGAPWVGMLVMTWFTIVAGIFLAWVTLRAGSVWPAVIGHAALNGIAGLGAMFLLGQSNLILGPTAAGLIGSIGFAIAAALIYFTPGALDDHRPKLDAIPEHKLQINEPPYMRRG